MSLIEAKAVWKRTDCSVTRLMISYLLVVEQHRTQIVIHALLKCQQENLYHEQRSEERFSRNAETELVCRLLLEKKKPALTVKQSKYNVDDVSLGFCSTGYEESRVTQLITFL